MASNLKISFIHPIFMFALWLFKANKDAKLVNDTVFLKITMC